MYYAFQRANVPNFRNIAKNVCVKKMKAGKPVALLPASDSPFMFFTRLVPPFALQAFYLKARLVKPW